MNLLARQPLSRLFCAPTRASLRLHRDGPSRTCSLSTLAILEQRDGKLNVSSLAAVTAGKSLGGSVSAFVACKGAKAVAEEAAKVEGLDTVIYVDNAAYDRVIMHSEAVGCKSSCTL